jgi:hypothetical protein
VEKSWTEGGLRNSWNKGLGTETATELKPFHLICAAPHAYWRRMIGLDGDRGKMPAAAWPHVWTLLEQLKRKHSFRFEFVALDIGKTRSSKNPVIQRAATLPLKELSLGLVELSGR